MRLIKGGRWSSRYEGEKDQDGHYHLHSLAGQCECEYEELVATNDIIGLSLVGPGGTLSLIAVWVSWIDGIMRWRSYGALDLETSRSVTAGRECYIFIIGD